MPELITRREIMDYLRLAAEQKIPMSAPQYLDAAAKLIILRQDLDEELITAQCELARSVGEQIMAGQSVAQAKALSQATESYKKYLLLKAERERLDQFIMISKKRVELSDYVS